MCLLVVCQPNSTPKREELQAGACRNPHGFGFAIVANDKIISWRSMSAKKTINKFLQLRSQYPDGYAMWHARLATHGVKNESNCHPFVVGNDERVYLAHNGVLDVKIHANDRRSDTRVFAEDILPAMGGVQSLDNDHLFDMISKWATGSKIAVLSVHPDSKYQCYIVNEKSGEWDTDGVWWSNKHHIPKPATIVGTYKPSHISYTYELPSVTYDWKTLKESYSSMTGDDPNDFTEDDEFTTCISCKNPISVILSADYCEWCDACVGCGSNYADCLCYNSSYKYNGYYDDVKSTYDVPLY